ncbi:MULTISPECIES: hypothetical protein [unclassified Acinetobacter]|uniref:hypothetical protein n=1 Tax=unclassified Acinetobacter TaxID=196816 RepID=UPI002934CCFF|nr:MULTISPECIES: hypothetical protein [unclassified Acinetobacter]WOE31982.1 hypothetical protein QSG84_01780 [Acinetobacter sp. SAAs470]WOE37450.1 hypothetical protein QSG86_10825 [Acinetobacter sp. SAAs474]
MNWEELYTHLMMNTGKDYDYIRREFDLPRLTALNSCNRNNPPAHVNMHMIRLMLEAFFGIDHHNNSNESLPDDDDELLNDLMSFPQGN